MAAWAPLSAWRAAVALGLLLLVAWAGGAWAKPAPSAVTAQPPPGFEDLTRPQQTVVDVLFGGARVGVASATYRPGRLTFTDPAKVVALLPRLHAAAAVTLALSGDLPTHAELICRDAQPQGCGELNPDVAGVIFDESRFAVEVFVNPRQLGISAALGPRYLPEPAARGSVVSSFAGAVSGQSGGPTSYGLQDRTVVAWGPGRFTAELADSSEQGFQVETLTAQLDRPGLRYEAGLLWSPAFDFTGQARMYGAGVGSQFDTRVDADQLAGAPLVVFLTHRSQVDVLRDGRLISSRVYDAGNQTLDTSYLPGGAYPVTVRIHEIDGSTRDLQMFFVKSHALPPPDAPGFFAYAGVLANGVGRGLPAAGRQVFLEAGYARRLSGGTSADVNAMLLGRTLLGEVGVTHLGHWASFHAAALAANDGNYGVLLDGSFTGVRGLVASVDLRKTWGPGLAALGAGQPADVFSAVTQSNLLSVASIQATGTLSYVYQGAQLGFNATYFDARGAPASYAYGPQLTWPFWQGQHAVATLGASFAKTNDGYQGLVSVRLQLFHGQSSVVADAGVAAEDGALTGRRAGPVASVVGAYVRPDVLRSVLTLSGQASRSLDENVIGGGAELRGPYGDFLGQVEDDSHESPGPGGRGGALRYSGNFSTSLAATGGGVVVGGADIASSGLVARMVGAPPDVVADVLVDGAPAARLHGDTSVPVFLSPYRVYRVSLQPVSGPAVAFDDDSDRRITLFAGDVQQVEWRVTQVTAVFGRAVDSAGRPLRAASIEGAREPAETDDNGYFQVEVAAGAQLTFRQPGARACRIALRPTPAGEAFARLGDVVCSPTAP